MSADQPPADPLTASRANKNTASGKSTEEANAWLSSLSVFNPIDHIKLISFVLRGQLHKLNLSKRYQVQSDLNRILPWTLSIISWGSILIASLVTDQLVGLNTQTRYSGLAIWAFGFLVSGFLGQQYNGAIQVIVSFLVSSLLQMKIVRWNSTPTILAVTFAMRILEFGFQLSIGLHFSRDFAFYLRHLLTPLMTLLSLYFTLFAHYIQYEETKSTILMVTLVALSVVATLMGFLYLTRVKKAATFAKAQRHKYQLLSLVLVPYGVAALFNWAFYLPFEEELIHEVLSIENFYSILCLGSVFLCIIYTVKETKDVSHRLVHAVFNPLFLLGYAPLLATSVYLMSNRQE